MSYTNKGNPPQLNRRLKNFETAPKKTGFELTKKNNKHH